VTKLQKSMTKTKTKTKREAWFDSHVIVADLPAALGLVGNRQAVRNALKAKVCGESQEAERSNE
jgi:hypothetical protein